MTHEHGGTREPQPNGPPPPDQQQFDPGGYFFAVVDTSGNLVDSSNGVDSKSLAPVETLQQAAQNGSSTAATTSSSGVPQRVYVMASTNADGDKALLEIGRSVQSEHDALSQLRTILAAVVAGSILPALAGGYLLSGRVLRPIKRSVDAQRAFIADASHELRTPVAVVRTNAELLERHLQSGRMGQSAGDTQALGDILSETDRLGKMVGQMLTLAQADAGQATFSRSDIEIGELAGEVTRSMRALAEAKGVALTADAAGGLWVSGDRERLREVVVTLLDNAIKYTGSGGRVGLAVRRAHRKAVLTVTDTGQGIPAASLPNIFKRFYRVDKARSRDEGGTGLGLAIARHIVEAHGGEIRIESEPGRGTTVTIELRLPSHVPQRETGPLPHEAV